MRNFLVVPLVAVGLFAFVLQASAHATVSPKTGNIGEWKTFTLAVPSEKPVATVGVRLEVPAGLSYVTPNVKPGWKIEVKKTGEGEAAVTTELNWKGGSIPAGQRDEFPFSVKLPAAAGAIAWKVYQTYADGTVVSWNQDPKAEQPKTAEGKSDFSKVGPYSETQVIDDLGAGPVAAAPAAPANESPLSKIALALSAIAIAIALASRRQNMMK